MSAGSSPRGHVVVLGGGISGLAAAHHLVGAASGATVTLIEAAERLGGKIATEQVDGFVIEAGPDSFLASKPRGVGLSAELGLADRLQGVMPQEQRAYVLWRDRWHELPAGLSGLAPTRLGPLARCHLLSPLGKARVALDYLLPARRGDGDESLGGFVRRRLGREAWERLVEPLMAGIYAADGDQLSLAATFPQLRAAERQHRSLIRGVLAARRAAPPDASPSSPFLTPVGGLCELATALTSALLRGGVDIQTGVMAERVTPVGARYKIALAGRPSLRADAVIVATPAFAAARLLADLDAALAADLAAIPYATTAIVSLAYRREEIPHPLAAHGYLVPRAVGSPILACTWSSRKWAGRAPEGWELLRVFVGRAGADEANLLTATDQDLLTLARQELAARLGVTAPPALSRVARWPDGMPQYLVGHPARLERIESGMQAFPGLFLAGSAYRGVGLPDCIASGERAAAAAMAHLARRPAGSSPAGVNAPAVAKFAQPGAGWQTQERRQAAERLTIHVVP